MRDSLVIETNKFFGPGFPEENETGRSEGHVLLHEDTRGIP